MARRRLADLYIVGKEVVIGDDSGEEPVTVWIQKLNPTEHATAVRRANAERSKVFSIIKKPIEECPTCGAFNENAELLQAIKSELYDLTREQMVDVLIAQELGRRATAIEAELDAEEEWAQDEYIKGLRESWDEELETRAVTDPDDIEAKRVKDELQRYYDQFTVLFEKEKASLKRGWDGVSDEEIMEETMKKQVEVEADLAWLRGYRQTQVWLSTRNNENHNIREFDSREEVENLQVEVYQRLIDEYNAISVNVVEGKELLVVENSSDSSSPPEA